MNWQRGARCRRFCGLGRTVGSHNDYPARSRSGRAARLTHRLWRSRKRSLGSSVIHRLLTYSPIHSAPNRGLPGGLSTFDTRAQSTGKARGTQSGWVRWHNLMRNEEGTSRQVTACPTRLRTTSERIAHSGDGRSYNYMAAGELTQSVVGEGRAWQPSIYNLTSKPICESSS